MKNQLLESDDNNFEIKKYKFNPIFIDKTKNTKNDDLIPNKKIYENAIPSMTDTQSSHKATMGQKGMSPSLNKNKTNTIPFNEKNKFLQEEEDINILRNNFKEKIALMEQEYNKKILKMEEQNKQLIENIKELYKKKLNDINNQMSQHLNKINKQNLDLINEVRALRANSISLQEHYDKMNELNNKWEEKFKNYKKNYENKYKQIANKIETELPLDKIVMEINSSLTPENLMKMIKLIELRNRIGYYSFILNLQEKYNEDYEKFDEINKEKIKNLKKYTIQRFDSLIQEEGKGNKNLIKKSIDLGKNEDKSALKKSEIVNYESNNLNNLNISKSLSITHDKFNSELESFNFNDDSIPNKDIQVLSPLELIK